MRFSRQKYWSGLPFPSSGPSTFIVHDEEEHGCVCTGMWYAQTDRPVNVHAKLFTVVFSGAWLEHAEGQLQNSYYISLLFDLLPGTHIIFVRIIKTIKPKSAMKSFPLRYIVIPGNCFLGVSNNNDNILKVPPQILFKKQKSNNMHMRFWKYLYANYLVQLSWKLSKAGSMVKTILITRKRKQLETA